MKEDQLSPYVISKEEESEGSEQYMDMDVMETPTAASEDIQLPKADRLPFRRRHAAFPVMKSNLASRDEPQSVSSFTGPFMKSQTKVTKSLLKAAPTPVADALESASNQSGFGAAPVVSSSFSKAIPRSVQLSHPQLPPAQSARELAAVKVASSRKLRPEPPQVTPQIGLFGSAAPSTVQGGRFDIPPPPAPPLAQSAIPLSASQSSFFGQLAQGFGSITTQAPQKPGGGFGFGEPQPTGLFGSASLPTVQGGQFGIPPPPAPSQAQSAIPLPVSQGSLFGHPTQAERKSEAATGGLLGSPQLTQGLGSITTQAHPKPGGGFGFGEPQQVPKKAAKLFGPAPLPTVQGGRFGIPPPPPPPPAPSQAQSAIPPPVSQGSLFGLPTRAERMSEADMLTWGLFRSPQLTQGFGSMSAQVPQKADSGFGFGEPPQTGLIGSAALSNVKGGRGGIPPPPPPPSPPSQAQSAIPFPVSQGFSLGKPAQAERKPEAATGPLFASSQIPQAFGSVPKQEPEKAAGRFSFDGQLFGSAAPPAPPPPPPPPALPTEERLTSEASPSGFGAPANLVKEKRIYGRGAMPTHLLESMSGQFMSERERPRPKSVFQQLKKQILQKKEVASVEMQSARSQRLHRAPAPEAPEESEPMEAEQHLRQTPPRLSSKTDALKSGGQCRERAPPAPPSALPTRGPTKTSKRYSCRSWCGGVARRAAPISGKNNL